MEAQDEDDISVVTIQDSDSADDLKFPPFNIRLLPSMTIPDSEIKQAHTALNTAYGTIKTKLTKMEQENKDLKMLLNRKKPTIAQSMSSYVDRNGESGVKPTSHSAILRQKRPGLSEENQHKRHGSWAHFSEKPDDRDSYVQFIETQIENSEKEKLRLKEELQQLRVRYTDNELHITKLKQENSKQDVLIQNLRTSLQEKNVECQRQHSSNEEIRKMNINLQQQLKRAVESYERVCVTNKTLEDRLQHHVDVQTKHKTGPSQEAAEASRLSVTDTAPPHSTESAPSQDTEVLLASLHQSLNTIQQQNVNFAALKKLALEQRMAINNLRQKLGEAQMDEDARQNSVAVTIQHPITCEDDLEHQSVYSNNPHQHSKGDENITTYKMPPKSGECDDDLTEQKEWKPRHKLRFPSQNNEDDYTPTSEDVPPWAPIKGGGGNGIGALFVNNTHNPFLSNDVAGEVRSDGVFDEAMGPEVPAPMHDCDSDDFTIHHSGESQTQVKHRLPSTMITSHQATYDPSNISPRAPPAQTPYWGQQAPHQPTANNGGAAFPVRQLPPPGENLTDTVLMNNAKRKNEPPADKLTQSQSEIIRRVSVPPPLIRRTRPGSTDTGPVNTRDPIGDLDVRCPPTPLTNGQHNLTYGRQSPNPQDPARLPAANRTPYRAGVNLQVAPNLNPFRVITQGMNNTSPRRLNSIEQNLTHQNDSLTNPRQRNNSNNSGKTNRDVNINLEQPPVEKLPGCSQNVPLSLNNDPLIDELGARKPVAHHNLSNTYLTVKLPPVENAEPPTSGSSGVGGASPEEAQTCPVCTQLFPTTTPQLQQEFEQHVNDCLPENERRDSQELLQRDKQCIMCERKFSADDQVAYETHVQSHFDDPAANFEVLQV